MNEADQQRVVVGVNGSRASQAALRWAAAEARLRKAALHVVYALDPTSQHAPYAPMEGIPTRDQVQVVAGVGLGAAVRAAFGPELPAWVTEEVADGVPERVLVDLSGGADLLVLGGTTAAATASIVGRSAGPVIRACLMCARCPVVVVGEPAEKPQSGVTATGPWAWFSTACGTDPAPGRPEPAVSFLPSTTRSARAGAPASTGPG